MKATKKHKAPTCPNCDALLPGCLLALVNHEGVEPCHHCGADLRVEWARAFDKTVGLHIETCAGAEADFVVHFAKL